MPQPRLECVQVKRFHVRFRDTRTGGMLPDDEMCWFDSMDEAEDFAVVTAAIATEEGEVWESSIFEDGRLHHQHAAPVVLGY